MSSNETPRGPVDATLIPRFAGPATFARLPRTDEVGRADVAVVGVPFDSGVSYRPGARFGPAAVREASRLLRPHHPPAPPPPGRGAGPAAGCGRCGAAGRARTSWAPTSWRPPPPTTTPRS